MSVNPGEMTILAAILMALLKWRPVVAGLLRWADKHVPGKNKAHVPAPGGGGSGSGDSSIQRALSRIDRRMDTEQKLDAIMRRLEDMDDKIDNIENKGERK